MVHLLYNFIWEDETLNEEKHGGRYSYKAIRAVFVAVCEQIQRNTLSLRLKAGNENMGRTGSRLNNKAVLEFIYG